MITSKRGWAAVLFALLAWGLWLGSAAADAPQGEVLLALTEDAAVGEPAELVARVVGPDREPLAGVAVTFVAELEFQNTFDTVTIGEATTDEAGVARVFYVPRTDGEVVVSARAAEGATEAVQEATGTLTVRPGPHLFHPEDPAHDLRARWDWFVQWTWLVVLPAGAFAIYLFIMFLLWSIGGDAAPRADSKLAPTVRRLILPAAGGGMVLVGAFVLIVGITLRPWADSNSGWRTELNLLDTAPGDYHRSLATFVEGAPTLESWRPRGGPAAASDADRAAYVGYGCATCHGLGGEGGVVGEALDDVSPSDVRKALKKSRGGMPAFSSLGAEEVDALVAFLTGAAPAKAPGPEAEATPVSAPAVPTVAPAEPTPTSEPTPTPTLAVARAEPASAPTTEPDRGGPVSLRAASAAITVDGDTSDWSEIAPSSVTLQQIGPIPGVEMGKVDPISADLRVAMDSERIYVLLEVPDDYDYVAEDHGLSAALAVMFRIDDPAAPHMGTAEENLKKSLGKVDIWHWELDCGPGEMSGGVTGIAGGNDPSCNFDDEWSTTPKEREDDGSRQAENSLAGVWEHTARAQGTGADGTWVFEMSRKLQTGDPDDAQFAGGMTAYMALAYWDADETAEGWTSEGHLQSSTGGWIEVRLP